MKKVIGIIFVMFVCIGLLGCEGKKPTEILENQPSKTKYDKTIRVELLDENNKPYEKYQLVNYYFLVSDKVVASDTVYIFPTAELAKTYFDSQTETGLRISDNQIVKNNTLVLYEGWTSSEVIKEVKGNSRTIKYEEL